MIYEARITAVNSRTVTRKKDGKTITIYEVEDSTGAKTATSRRDLANEANQLLNQNAELQVRVEQNGQWENRYLDDIRPAQNGSQQLQAPIQTAQRDEPQHYGTQQPQQNIPAEGEGTSRDWSIWRQTATKVAAQVSTTPQEFWFNVNQMMAYYSAGLQPEFSNSPPPQQQAVTSYAPAERAQQAAQKFIPDDVPHEESFDTDSDIPFE